MAAPINDLCSNAIEITSLPFSDLERDVTDATRSIDDPVFVDWGNFEPQQTVWYKITPAANITLRVTDNGWWDSPAIGVFTGSCGTLVEHKLDDSFNGDFLVDLLEGVTYYILRGSYGWETTVNLTVAEAADLGQVTGLTLALKNDAQAVNSVLLQWDAVPGADRYRVEMCTGADCSGFAFQSNITQTTWLHLSRPPETVLRYRVKAVSGPLDGPFSSVAEIVTGERLYPPPASLTVKNASFQEAAGITVTWLAAPLGSPAFANPRYQLQRCTGGGCEDFTTLVTQNGLLASGGSTTLDTVYRYRVRTLYLDGTQSEWLTAEYRSANVLVDTRFEGLHSVGDPPITVGASSYFYSESQVSPTGFAPETVDSVPLECTINSVLFTVTGGTFTTHHLQHGITFGTWFYLCPDWFDIEENLLAYIPFMCSASPGSGCQGTGPGVNGYRDYVGKAPNPSAFGTVSFNGSAFHDPFLFPGVVTFPPWTREALKTYKWRWAQFCDRRHLESAGDYGVGRVTQLDAHLHYSWPEVTVAWLAPAPEVPPMQRASYILFSRSITERQIETRLTKTCLQLLTADPPAAPDPSTLGLVEIVGDLWTPQGDAVTYGQFIITPRRALQVGDELMAASSVVYDVTGPLSINLAPSNGVLYDVKFDPDPDDTVTPINLKSGYFTDVWDVPSTGPVDIASL